MLKTIVQSTSKFSGYYKRPLWTCPKGPIDPNTYVTALCNGMRVATEELESPLGCVSLFLSAGSRYETRRTNGLTHFIEHFAFKGLKSMDKHCFEETINLMGARMTAHTSREMQIFSIKVPSGNIPLAIDILARIILELNINDQEIEQERDNIAMELIDADNNPKKVVFDYLHSSAFQGTPLGQRVIGSSQNIARFTADATVKFMCEHYQPYRMILATSGKVANSQILKLANSCFGSITPQPGCEPEPGPKRFTGSTVIYRDDSMPLAHVAIAFEAPGYCSPSYIPMLIMKNIVGRWDKSQGLGDGNAPLVARELAKGNLCERYEAFYIPYQDIGLWGVYFVADRWKLDEVVFHIQQQWMQLCTTVYKMELQRAVNVTAMELAKRYDSVVSSSYDIGTQMLYTCGRKSLQQLYDAIELVKLHTIRELADKYLYDRCPAVAAMGPTESLPDYTRIRGGQWWLRI